MRYMVILLMSLLMAPILHSADSPLKATNVAMHVLQYRENFQDGWRPIYKADLDITLRNVSQSAIDTATLCLDFLRHPELPGQVICGEGSQKFTIGLQPGNSTKVGWQKVFTFGSIEDVDAATGSFTDVGTAIVVSLVSLKYSNGMIGDFGRRPIGQGIIPPSKMFPANSGCEEPVDLTDKVSAPRFLGYGSSQSGDGWNFGVDSKPPPGKDIAVISETITFQVVINNNGSVCDARVLKDSLGTEVDSHRIEALKKTIWFPAIENGIPVAVRMVKTLTIEHTVGRF